MQDEKDPPAPEGSTPSKAIVPKWLRDEPEAPPRKVRRPAARHLDPNVQRTKRAKAHETRVAKELGGKRLAASGAIPFGKHDRNTAAADIRTENLLVQHKGCAQQSIGVKREWLRDLTVESKRRSLDPALVVYFEGERLMEPEWIMVPKSVWERLMHNQGQKP